MKKNEKQTLIRYNMETKAIYEKLTGESLSIMSPCIRKVFRRKDCTFKIEPIIYFSSSNKDIDDYNKTLERKRGYVAFIVNDDLLNNFPITSIEAFTSCGKDSLYIREKKLGDSLDLLDYELGNIQCLNPEDLVIVGKVENKSYMIASAANGWVKNISAYNKYIRSANASGIYYSVNPEMINPTFREYILHFEKMGEETYTLVNATLHMLPGMDPNTLGKHKKTYLEVLQESFPVVLRNTNNNEYLIHSYSTFMSQLANTQKMSLGYIVPPIMVEMIKCTEEYKWLTDIILELEKTPSGYRPSKMEKNKKMEL